MLTYVAWRGISNNSLESAEIMINKCERQVTGQNWTECKRCEAMWHNLNAGYRPAACYENGIGAYNGSVLTDAFKAAEAARKSAGQLAYEADRERHGWQNKWYELPERTRNIWDDGLQEREERTPLFHYPDPVPTPSVYDCVRVTQETYTPPDYEANRRAPLFTLTEEEVLPSTEFVRFVISWIVAFAIGFAVARWML